MGRLIASNLMSLDGFVAGPKGELDWFVTEKFMEDEFGAYARKLISSVDAILLGRRTYKEFVSYWPGVKDDEIIAAKMNSLPKFVFSKTLKKVQWGKHAPPKLVRGDAVTEVRKIKKQMKGDIAIYGSGKLVSTLMKAGLVDELHLLVKPIVLGKGKEEFKGFSQRYPLRLIGAQHFASGDVFLRYESAPKAS